MGNDDHKRKRPENRFGPILDEMIDNPGRDNAQKRYKPKPDAPPSQIDSFPSPEQTTRSEDPQHSTPSTSSKHSSDSSRSPPSSIGSKFQIVALDGKSDQNKTISPVSKRKEDQIELGSVDSLADEQLAKRRKIGGIYNAIGVHRETTVKRLKDLCSKEPTIDVGIEMADAAYLLKLMSFSTNEIETAGQKAHRGAMLLLQAEILRNNGLELLAESQKSLEDTL